MKRMVKIALVVLMATASVAFAQTKKWELEVFKSGTKVGVMNFELRQEGDKHYAAFVSSHSMSTCFVTERPASVVETDDELTITIEPRVFGCERRYIVKKDGSGAMVRNMADGQWVGTDRLIVFKPLN